MHVLFLQIELVIVLKLIQSFEFVVWQSLRYFSDSLTQL